MSPTTNNAFVERKKKILSQLSIPDQEYTDLSPKGSVDEAIRNFVDEINSLEGFVTTSSCSGRIAVFHDGVKEKKKSSSSSEDPAAAVDDGDDDDGDDQDAPPSSSTAIQGGKGGGQWLYVSHSPLDLSSVQKEGELLALFGMSPEEQVSVPSTTDSRPRFVHFRFEPMILHILTSSLENAQKAHGAAMSAGFRESGIHSITGDSPNPIVAIRTMGLAFSSIIAQSPSPGEIKSMVTEPYLRTLVQIANERFTVNSARTERFRRALLGLDVKVREGEEGKEWEPAVVRRERKRKEGLRRKLEMEMQKEEKVKEEGDEDEEILTTLPVN